MEEPERQAALSPVQVALPETWRLQQLVVTGPVEGDSLSAPKQAKASQFQQNLVIMSEPVTTGETAETYRQKQQERLKELGVTPREAARPEQLELSGGIPGLLTEQVLTGPNGEKVRQMQLCLIKGSVAYTLTASHLDGMLFECGREQFRAMLLSFTL